jgi:hypothetical protein
MNFMVKVKLSLRVKRYLAMKTYYGSGGIAPRILNPALYGGEWSASRSDRFIPGIGAPVLIG